MRSTASRYEYVIVACCFMFLFVNVGFISTTFNVFQPHITAIIGDSLGSMVLFVRNLSSFAAMLFVAAYYERLDCRLGVTLATGLSTVGLILFGLSSGFPAYCVGAVFTGIGYGLGGAVAMTLLIGRWFEGRTGTAIGIATMGSGLAAIVMPVCVSAVVHSLSLSAAFFMEAGIAAAVGALCFLLVRNDPPAAASAPAAAPAADGAPAPAPAPASAVSKGASAPDSASAPVLSKRMSAAMLAAMLCLGIVSLGGTTFYAVLLTTNGIDASFAASLISVGGIVLFASKFLTGLAFDKLGTFRATVLFFAFLVAGVMVSCFAGTGSVPLIVVGVVSMYFGVSLATVGISQWSLVLSGPQDRAKTVRNFQLFYTAGGFVCTAFPGVLMDLLGTYVVSYALFAVAGLASMIIVLRCVRTTG